MAEESRKEPVAETGKEIEKAGRAHLTRPLEEIERMVDTYFPRGWLRPLRWDWPSLGEIAAPFEGKLPKVDIIDRDSEIVVRAEVPGVEKKDLDVSVTENTVTIRGQSSREEKEEKGDYFRCEIARGAFARTVALPGDVDSARVKAAFKDGLLELTIPKIEKSKRHRVKLD